MEKVDTIYSISELANITGYQAHVLRYYEKEFELEIPRNNANHRYYTMKELEVFNYIKNLQEKGFSNKQIKLILKSPEIILDNQEVAITLAEDLMKSDDLEQLQNNFTDMFFSQLKDILETSLTGNNEVIDKLRYEIVELRNELTSKERDVLICENAKLKMKVKEKSYEVAELRSKLAVHNNKKGIMKKLFKSKN